MRSFLAVLIFYCSTTLSSEGAQKKESISFYEKKPAVQRQIFINEVKKLISNVKKSSKKFTIEFQKLLSEIKTNTKKTTESLPNKPIEFQKLLSGIKANNKKTAGSLPSPLPDKPIEFQKLLSNIKTLVRKKNESLPTQLDKIKPIKPFHPTDDVSTQAQGGKGHTSDGSEAQLEPIKPFHPTDDVSTQAQGGKGHTSDGSEAQLESIKPNKIKTVESLLVKSLEFISNGRLDEAINSIDELITLVPNFKLAHLIRGDILTAYSMSNSVEINSKKVIALKKEAKRRIKGYLLTHKDNGQPKFNIIPDKNNKYLIYVDMDSSRLFTFKRDKDKYLYLSDYYVSIGKNGYGKRYEGDKKTPFGTYFLQNKIERKLTDFYGEGAYPLNYPNEFDKVKKYTGSGIWIHGTPKTTYSRPPEASDGCIVLSNKDLINIQEILNTAGTPVILSNLSINELSLRNRKDIKNDQKEILNSIERWRKSWVNKNFDEYMNFYISNAKYNNKNYKIWSIDKKKIFNKSKNIQISLDNISLYEYPSNNNALRIVIFNQNYKSNLIANQTTKKQIWQKNNGQWKIIYEGTN